MNTRGPVIKSESLRQLMENAGSEHWVRWERADFSIRKANKVEPEKRVARWRRRGKQDVPLSRIHYKYCLLFMQFASVQGDKLDPEV